MASLNNCNFIGNLGSDVETRNMPNGDSVASVNIAVTEKFKDKQGNQKEATQWIPLTFYRRQAEIASQYLRKGSSIYVSGKWNTQSWDKNGEKKYKTGLFVSNFQILGSKGGDKPSLTPSQAPQGQNNEAPPNYEDNLPF